MYLVLKSLTILVLLLLVRLKPCKAFNCYWCDSKQGKCQRNSITGLTAIETCKQGYEFCAVQQETNSSGIVVQFTRGCVANCPQMVTKWESNTFFKSKFCRFCCNAHLCNNITGDPCDPFAGAPKLWVNTVSMLCASLLSSLVTLVM